MFAFLNTIFLTHCLGYSRVIFKSLES